MSKKYITIQWVLSATGSTVGAIIAFSANYQSTEAIGVSSGVYIAFIAIMCLYVSVVLVRLVVNNMYSAIGIVLVFIIKPENVVRDDGRHIAIFKEPTVIEEVKGVFSVMTDPKILFLLPAMFVGEMCLALVSSINGQFILGSLVSHTGLELTCGSSVLQSSHKISKQPALSSCHDPYTISFSMGHGQPTNQFPPHTGLHRRRHCRDGYASSYCWLARLDPQERHR